MTLQNPVQPVTQISSRAETLPRHILIGYWHNWQNDCVKYIPLKEVSADFDVIHVAFATPAETQDGRMTFSPSPETSACRFKSDIRRLQEMGKKVVISVGGATGSAPVADPRTRDNFARSMTSIVRQFGFDGIDINLEGQVRLDPGDCDYKHPTSPSIIHLIGAIRAIRQDFGAEFILSMAPETIAVQGGCREYGGVRGAYLPVIDATRDIITYIQVQHYNSEAMTALDGRKYPQGTADFHVAMLEMLLQGFPVKCSRNRFFFPLRPDQVTMGLPASAEGANGGYTPPDELQKSLNYLSRGKSFGGSYVLRNSSGYPDLRGVMTWSINWDAAACFEFSTTTHSFLEKLP